MDQMEPTDSCPSRIQEFPDGVLLSGFLQTLHLRPLDNGPKQSSDQDFQDEVMQDFKKGQDGRFNFAPKEGTSRCLLQLRDSLTDDFTRGTMRYADDVLNSLLLLHSLALQRNKEPGTPMHMDVSDFSTMLLGQQHCDGVKGWSDSAVISKALPQQTGTSSSPAVSPR
ncbi:hypothetical protein WJX73_000945 [Symbiochloris irregularis]|uniref:Uncharacterized protein n=1 Tax=Symbiochloris irregularis TaxID=706552 RepID=A0AAW1P4F6_9CHLO